MFVNAKDLSHVKVRSTVRIFQIFDGNVKTLTDSPELNMIEVLSEFDLEEYFALLNEKFDGNIQNGFYIIDHNTKRGHIVLSDNWDERVEQLLTQQDLAEIGRP